MKKDNQPWLKPFKRKFIPTHFKITTWDQLELFYQKLADEKIINSKQLKTWLQKWGELEAVTGEERTDRQVQMTCDTNSEQKKKMHLDFIQQFQPKIEEWQNTLNKKYAALTHRIRLPKKEYKKLGQILKTEIELFSEKNIPLNITLSELIQKHQEITGNWAVHFDGKERTLPEMNKLLYSLDRNYRQKTWHALVNRRLQDKDTLENLFDEMLKCRSLYAKNLNLKDYREYCFKSKLRDYTPEDCLTLHQSIEKTVLPVIKKIRSHRKEAMKLPSLKPWDLQVDPHGKPPLKPFSTVVQLQNGVEKIFYKIDSRLGNRFNSIRPYMDLDSRKGKAPGGYQATFDEKRRPFIFTNASGVQRDVQTLLHESGHAFHTLEAREQNLYWYRYAPMEFCEVASMTQELLALPYYSIFYPDQADYTRACQQLLTNVIDVFPWIAWVDAFQHWTYTHPKHTRDERDKAWLELANRFEIDTDWSDISKDIHAHTWHAQLHIFQVPFYYIEYAIAQLGALQIYRNYKKNPASALTHYLNALALGGSQDVSFLFKKGGIKFDFSYDLLQELMDMLALDLNI